MSPHLNWEPKAGRSYRVGLDGQAGSKPSDDVVLDAAGRETGRIRDRGRRRIAVCDDDEALETEEIGAAVRVRIEPRAQPPRRRADEQAAELPAGCRLDLAAESAEHRADRPLERLERDVPGEAVGDEDVGGAFEDVAAFGVALEVEIGGGE